MPVLLLPGAAAPQAYVVDAARSEISAKVAFFGLASKARFPKASGGITLDPARPERIDLSVVLDATALTAPDKVTLARLNGPKFFDTARHPIIAFRGTTLRLRSEREGEVAGQITARGITRPATLAVSFAGPPRRADGRAPLTLTGQTVIDRRDFGMTAYPLVVGRKVKITIRATLVPG